MIKMVVFNKRKNGVTMDEFRDYYENVHVPLVRPFFPTVSAYRRNYVDREKTALTERNAEVAASNSDFDSITEVFFADWAAFEAFRDAHADPAIREQIVADEVKFLDPSAIRRYIVTPEGDQAWL